MSMVGNCVKETKPLVHFCIWLKVTQQSLRNLNVDFPFGNSTVGKG